MDFLALLSAAGIPTTQAELEAVWRQTISDTGSQINNDNRMSPFWRVITACVTNPVLWLVNYLAMTIMPNAYVKTATGEFLDLLADAVNLTRKPASFTVGKITFTRTNVGQDVTIDSGVIIQTASINGVVYQVETTESKAFATGELTLDVAVTALVAGTAQNLAANYYSILLVPILGIVSVANGVDWITIPGADIESDTDLRARIKVQFGTAAHFHTDAVYKSLIAAFPGVHIDAIWIEHDAPRGAGTANAYVLFDFAAPVSDYLDAINTFITDEGHHGHGDDLQVMQMPEHEIGLEVDIWCEKSLLSAEKEQLRLAVMSFINAAFRENSAYEPTLTLPYSRFSFSKLAEELHKQFPSLHSIDFNSNDLVSELWIPRLVSLDIAAHYTE